MPATRSSGTQQPIHKMEQQVHIIRCTMKRFRSQSRKSLDTAREMSRRHTQMEYLVDDGGPPLGELYRLIEDIVRMHALDNCAADTQLLTQNDLERTVADFPDLGFSTKHLRASARSALDNCEHYRSDMIRHLTWCAPYVWSAVDALANAMQRSPQHAAARVRDKIRLYLVPQISHEEIRDRLALALGIDPSGEKASPAVTVTTPSPHDSDSDEEALPSLYRHPVAYLLPVMSARRSAPGTGGVKIQRRRKRS